MMAHPVLAQIAGAHDYALPDGLAMQNGNSMLGGYHGTYGVKIGYTNRASHTIVVAAERDGRRVYASVLGSKVPYADATALLDWAFSQRPTNC
jgi:D-alanyl-D-alanine carboxypeptidase (penicillin-binding protein 5/6)